MDFFLLASSDSQPWWFEAMLGSLGALVLSIFANIIQWKRNKEKEDNWEIERKEWQAAVKEESDRATDYGERALILITKSEGWFQQTPKILEGIESTVKNQHDLTRDKIEKTFATLEDSAS